MCLLKWGANTSSKGFQYLSEEKASRVLMVGLKGAGKTSLLKKMASQVAAAAASTVGFDVEGIQVGSMNITVWDIGSTSQKIRSLWRHQFQGANGIVFVLDSCDDASIDLAKAELDKILKSMQKTPVMVFANKQDLYGALCVDEVVRRLGLRHRKCTVQPTCAMDGSGISQGLNWLASEMNSL